MKYRDPRQGRSSLSWLKRARKERSVRRLVAMLGLLLVVLALAGCGPAETAEPPTPTRPLRPTFTPTNPAEAQATETAVALAAATATPTPTDTPELAARLTVTSNTANVRRGPGTNYPVVSQVSQGQIYDVIGKNQAGTWWQIDLEGQLAWIAESVSRVENPQLVALASDIPAAPPTNTPRPAPPPTATPVPPPPAEADPCAGIGGDGCKFRVTGGPAFAPNNGAELKLTFAFIHSGRGNEAQGSYFVALDKEGVGRLPIPDSNRSWTGDKRSGPNGAYNYEQKLGLGAVGGNVAGCYVGWVIDGNGERDSQNFRFCVPEGQGEVWLQFDQA